MRPYIITSESTEGILSIVGAVDSIEAGVELIYGHYERAGEDIHNGIDRDRPERYIFNRSPKDSDGDDGYKSYFTLYAGDL